MMEFCFGKNNRIAGQPFKIKWKCQQMSVGGCQWGEKKSSKNRTPAKFMGKIALHDKAQS